MLAYGVSMLLDNQPGWSASLGVKRLLKSYFHQKKAQVSASHVLQQLTGG